ncbi:hypothetical protein PVK06_003078 [Gossypium arboreum]|uniref:Uncharacterized protein n=1 Tax=Gossypium arboreum TaxID=29729 RepID=A0ABR0R5B7_GOSAR|nr:hypothetical protein PVK06_003078 [Gossypium arboreum]
MLISISSLLLCTLLPYFATVPVWIGLYQALSTVTNEVLLTEGFFWIPSLGGPTTIAARQSGSGISWLNSFVTDDPAQKNTLDWLLFIIRSVRITDLLVYPLQGFSFPCKLNSMKSFVTIVLLLTVMWVRLLQDPILFELCNEIKQFMWCVSANMGDESRGEAYSLSASKQVPNSSQPRRSKRSKRKHAV